MENFIQNYSAAAMTTLGMFWMAFWAFGLGYFISAMIQVFVTEQRMKDTMGETGPKSVLLGTFFGFISSSCSFAALSTTRSIFTKGAGFVPSMAFLLASTNLVIELGIIIAVFLSWQFVVGEYVGGMLLILLVWLFVKIKYPTKLIETARTNAKKQSQSNHEHAEEDKTHWKALIVSKKGWQKVAHRYVMEWQMVWKDVTVGFTLAGIIAAFVPASFFEALFIGSSADGYSFWQILTHTIVGPIAAFFTFIGSMGNIPLAAVLFANGVSFAGIIAFIFSDLVVFPVLRIQTKFYGFKMAIYIAGLFLAASITTAILLHYGLSFFDLLPSHEQVRQVIDRDFFKIDYTFFFNLFFGVMTVLFAAIHLKKHGVMAMGSDRIMEKFLFVFAVICLGWLTGGVITNFI